MNEERRKERKELRERRKRGRKIVLFQQPNQIRKPNDILWVGFLTQKTAVVVNTTLFLASKLGKITSVIPGSVSVGELDRYLRTQSSETVKHCYW